MGKFFAFTLLFGIISFGNLSTAHSPDVAAAEDTSVHQEFLTSSVNGIMIPNDVLSEVQLEYQGFAVVEAKQVYRDGKQAYQLKVGRDIYDSEKSFYLFYAKDWKFIKKEKIIYYQPNYSERELKEEIQDIEESYEEIEENLRAEFERIESEMSDSFQDVDPSTVRDRRNRNDNTRSRRGQAQQPGFEFEDIENPEDF